MDSVTVRNGTFSTELFGADSVGHATPFVWGHGLTSSRADEDVHPLLDFSALAQDRQLLRYDARGHGESGALESPEQGDWRELAADQIALIDHVGFGDVHLGGASMGTGTALFAALELGARVRSLVLAIPPTAWASRAEQIGIYGQMADVVEAAGTNPLIVAQQAVPVPDPFVDDDEYGEHRAQRLRKAHPSRLAMAFRGASTADLPTEADIATLTARTLILAWSGDAAHPVSTAQRLVELMPNAELVIASTSGQFATWTDRARTFLLEADRER